MTTREAEALYEAQHVHRYAGRPAVVFNPLGRDLGDLPVIYGFNAGGRPGMLRARLIAQDGTPLGGHCCSSEGYMTADLAIVGGGFDERHKDFRAHYPDGYRMEFVGETARDGHAGLQAALAIQAQAEDAYEAKREDAREAREAGR